MGQKYEIMCYFALYFPKKNPMNLELHIARRIARTSEGEKPSVMERIAVFSVALSLAVMILSLAVIMGFKREISRKMVAFTGHVVVTDVRNLHAVNASPITASPHLDSLIGSEAGVRKLNRYAQRGGIIRTKEAIEGVLLKGVGADYDLTTFSEWLVDGALPRIGDTIRTKDILLSEYLAQRLEVGVNDRIEMLFVEAGELPFRDRFKVAGIYASGMEELDRRLVVTDLRNVQRLSQWGEQEISGYEVLLHDLQHAPQTAARLDTRLLYDESDEAGNLVAQSVQQLHSGTFDWLKAHDVNAAVILTVMLIVAFFNMASALLIIVLERMRMIGLLKALGMSNRSVRHIFRYRAALIALRGLLWGNLIGLAVCFVQARFHLLSLDTEGYLLSSVPIAVEWGWWLGLNLGFTLLIFLLMGLPASVAGAVKPDKMMRYD